ncbi:MAG: hypothetical protein ACRCYC_01930 [Paraclostridium sp.]|uniref:hypothetical protein n=1 Tax=Paraclostridium sp. TaxID=2023273 RepID=UPI003F31B64C
MMLIRDLVEYNGIEILNIPKNDNIFKNIYLEERVLLPLNKHDIKQITKVDIFCDITESKVIKTAMGKSFEGQILTGGKLFVAGNMKIKFQYISYDGEQLLNSFIHDSLYSGTIVLPEGSKEELYIQANTFVEDLYIISYREREIYLSIDLLLLASVC